MDGQQAIDKKTITACRRHPASRGVRTGDQADVFEIGHHVAHCRRGQIQPGILRQRSRTDRLSIRDIEFDQGLQQGSGAVVEHVLILQK
jgi:hypothetical protein